MDSNVTKNTFFYRLFEFEFFQENLSLKRLIENIILSAIALYKRQHPEVNNWQQITKALWSKITLCNGENISWQLKYRCAIAFPLANLVHLTPLSVANELVALLLSEEKKVTGERNLAIVIHIVESGWIDFSLCDRNIAIWLDRLVEGLINQTNLNSLVLSAKKSKNPDNLFPLEYIYNRSYSLLKLGEREGLIVLDTNGCCLFKWQIMQPLPFPWRDSSGNLCLSYSQEKALLWQICLMMDYLAETKQYSPAHWKQFTIEMSRVWVRFVAHCRFCGEVKIQNSTLAIARLGLIAMTHWCLQALLDAKLNILPQRDLEVITDVTH